MTDREQQPTNIPSNPQFPAQSVELIRDTLIDMRKNGLTGGLPQDHAFTLLAEIERLTAKAEENRQMWLRACADMDSCACEWVIDPQTGEHGDEIATLCGAHQELFDKRRQSETKPTRDADHCDYPDCEQHWKGLLFDCVQGWLKGDNVVGPMQIAMRALGLPEKAGECT